MSPKFMSPQSKFLTLRTSAVLGLLCTLGMGLVFDALAAPDTHAEPYALSISFVSGNDTDGYSDIASPTMELNVSPSKNGTFSKSNTSTIGVGTTSATGYTLSIAASNSNGDKLVNSSDSDANTNYISSISSAITEEQFKALPSDGSSSAYNNQWGYLPSMWNGASNNLFRPAPTTAGHVLNSTSGANAVASATATDVCKRYACDKYDLTVGARVDVSQKIGSYSNTYVVYATANGTPYTIVFKDDTVSGMPSDISSNSASSTVTIPNDLSKPTRDGYSFIGWCSGTVSHNADGKDTCSGTVYQNGSTWAITEGATTNNLTLYAMWSGNYTIESVTNLQDFSTMPADKKAKVIASMTTDKQYQLTDNRDSKVYWVAKLRDGNVWMTQGLDLTLNNGTALEHTKSDIGWTENKVTKTWNPATTANTGSFNIIDTSGTDGRPKVDNWPNSNDVPYSTRPYYSTSGNYAYMVSSGNNNNDTATNEAGCKSSLGDECSHYKVGTYYNFAAATATNSVNGYLGHTAADSDNYTVMPDSICPAGWRLPHGLLAAATNGTASVNNSEFDTLLYAYGITPKPGATQGQNIGFADGMGPKVRVAPLYFVRSGYVYTSALNSRGALGYSWSSTISAANYGYYLGFNASNMLPAYSSYRLYGFPVRCLVR